MNPADALASLSGIAMAANARSFAVTAPRRPPALERWGRRLRRASR